MAQAHNFSWQTYPQAEKVLLDFVEGLQEKHPVLRGFAEQLVVQTSTRLFDWLDHILLPGADSTRKTLEAAGFVPERRADHRVVYAIPDALFPKVLLTDGEAADSCGVALRVESLEDFLAVNGFSAEIQGQPLSHYRTCTISRESGVSFVAVERRAPHLFSPEPSEECSARHYIEAREMWQTIARACEDQADEDQIFTVLFTAAERVVSLLGKNRAAHLVCQCERDYWMSRNHVARIQKERQDGLGLGWANHDHHAFRSSRHNFSRLIRLFQVLGFEGRERLYAGVAAGWGAQVMEHPAGLVLFLEVDLDEEEAALDYLTHELTPRNRLGIVGLWCALHGDSILKAGLHHLAVHALFSKLREDLQPSGVSFMAPFNAMEHLKQVFSKGEVWAVERARLQGLVQAKQITRNKAQKFAHSGSVGSHLENIERRHGFKGFNQVTDSDIIRRLDPRTIK